MRLADDSDDIIGAINVTPLVDIVLVLLVVLMTAVAYVATRAIPMDLPEQGVDGAEPPTIAVSIDAEGRWYADGEAVTASELRERAARLARDRSARAIVAADPQASHDSFVRAIDVLRLAGIRRYAVQVEGAE